MEQTLGEILKTTLAQQAEREAQEAAAREERRKAEAAARFAKELGKLKQELAYEIRSGKVPERRIFDDASHIGVALLELFQCKDPDGAATHFMEGSHLGAAWREFYDWFDSQGLRIKATRDVASRCESDEVEIEVFLKELSQ